MLDYKDNVEFVEVWGWDELSGDEKLFGSIRKCREGYQWFHPARKVVLSCKAMRDISKKIAEMNYGV